MDGYDSIEGLQQRIEELERMVAILLDQIMTPQVDGATQALIHEFTEQEWSRRSDRAGIPTVYLEDDQ